MADLVLALGTGVDRQEAALAELTFTRRTSRSPTAGRRRGESQAENSVGCAGAVGAPVTLSRELGDSLHEVSATIWMLRRREGERVYETEGAALDFVGQGG